jgi:hypothetical protein
VPGRDREGLADEDPRPPARIAVAFHPADANEDASGVTAGGAMRSRCVPVGLHRDGARALILVALAGLGLSAPIQELPALGIRPFLLGLVIMLAIGVLWCALLASGALPLPAPA